MSGAFARVWEFEVAPGAEAEFRRCYGPAGAWAELFRRGAGFIGTTLLHDASMARRYLTIDRWQDEGAYRAFCALFADEYAALDRACDSLTMRETDLGTFEDAGDA